MPRTLHYGTILSSRLSQGKYVRWKAAQSQAGLLRNPELMVNVENIGNVQPLQGDINSPKSVAQEVVQQYHYYSPQPTDRT